MMTQHCTMVRGKKIWLSGTGYDLEYNGPVTGTVGRRIVGIWCLGIPRTPNGEHGPREVRCGTEMLHGYHGMRQPQSLVISLDRTSRNTSTIGMAKHVHSHAPHIRFQLPPQSCEEPLAGRREGRVVGKQARLEGHHERRAQASLNPFLSKICREPPQLVQGVSIS